MHSSRRLNRILAGVFCALHWVKLGLWTFPHCFSATDLELVELQRRRGQLHECLRSMKFPPVKSFTVDGKTYQLPLNAMAPPSREPRQEELEYLAGFFDGDGCVHLCTDTRYTTLSVGQSIDSAEILLRFCDAFGGGIQLSTNRAGLSRTVLKWTVGGTASKRAASLMAKVSSLKHAQLKIGSSKISYLDRAAVRNKLTTLKEPSHVPTEFCGSWAYFAVFFDAEGCISITTRFSLRLVIEQKNHHVAEQLLCFLHQPNLDRWNLYQARRRNISSLACQHRETCVRTLRHMVDHGLLTKKPQAALVLGWDPSCRFNLALREAVSKLNGQQMRYGRLDDRGVLRAQEIKRLQEKLQRSASTEGQEVLQRKIKNLQQKQAKGKLLFGLRTLKADICTSLSEGGYFDCESGKKCLGKLACRSCLYPNPKKHRTSMVKTCQNAQLLSRL